MEFDSEKDTDQAMRRTKNFIGKVAKNIWFISRRALPLSYLMGNRLSYWMAL